MPNIAFRSDYHTSMFTIAAGYGSFFNGSKMRKVDRSRDLYFLIREIIDGVEPKDPFEIAPPKLAMKTNETKPKFNQQLLIGLSVGAVVAVVGTVVGVSLIK